MKKVFKIFNIFDICLWTVSVVAVVLAFTLSPRRDYFTLVSAITGVTALMFIVKGNVIGQFLVVMFAVLYGIVSYFFRYYGEMITYLAMSTPAAICAIVSWLKHPYKDKSQVKVGTLNAKKIATVFILSGAVTASMYFILKELGTANLVVSTLSVTTSMAAFCLVIFRSPLYGVAYACNDAVLIVLWVLATVKDISYLPMVLCFVLFFVYDLYGFINWSLMKKRQNAKLDSTTEETD